MQFHFNYFAAAVLLFFTEVFIAAFINDTIIRPYGGDFLVVIFLYFLLKSFFNIPVKNAIFGVLFFAFAVEASQYFRLISLLNRQDNRIASMVLGNHFEWLDIVIYILAALCIYSAEKIKAGYLKAE
ncbi:DUF2809 domain-containing protein [Salinimicrobium sp. MT39]|uniref:DUF2809 domain-containing protein n=1 Tax=Salinimicrobium profundisediminis TaxID=2994553 RepID=A0A9X3CZA2_9FLAO|nr:DUF2809 domain-containing protein [Salinimicrobium profundisediminis]